MLLLQIFTFGNIATFILNNVAPLVAKGIVVGTLTHLTYIPLSFPSLPTTRNEVMVIRQTTAVAFTPFDSITLSGSRNITELKNFTFTCHIQLLYISANIKISIREISAVAIPKWTNTKFLIRTQVSESGKGLKNSDYFCGK